MHRQSLQQTNNLQKGFGDYRSGDPLFYKMIPNRPKPDIHEMEILAPAGSVLAAKAAVEAGADAVYIGGSRFGARAYADNPGEDELLELIDDLHLHKKKIYLTVNTLLKEDELEKELYGYLAPYYEAGLDAVIVQDPGVMRFILREFPEMAVHASTQMTITGPSGARMLEKQGVTRVVPARELSLQEIREIREATGLEIECFVHGALCYCYSGRCLLSSILGGRSGNRGRCAQPCRLPYAVSDRTGRLNGRDEQYMLSPKDMCTVELLPEILAAGVTSLKIEGRMKKPEYTAGVVSIYRKYLDQTLSGTFKGVTRQDRQILFDLYNRDGFHQSYYKQHNGKHMMALKNEKLEKTARDRNEALFADIHRQYCETETKLPVTGLASFCEGEPMSLYLQQEETSAFVTAGVVQTARNHPMEETQVRKQLVKTGDSPFDFTELNIEMRGAAFAPVKELNALRREGLDALKETMLLPYRRTCPQISGENVSDIPIHHGKPEMAVLVSTKDQLSAVLSEETLPERIYVEYTLWRQERQQLENRDKHTDTRWFLALPQMLRESHREKFLQLLPKLEQSFFAGYLVRTMEEFCILKESGTKKEICLDDCMYTLNMETLAFYREQGATRFTAPAELNRHELKKRPNGDSEMVIYGRQLLMVSAQCLRQNTTGCDHKSGTLTLKDRKDIEFPAKCCCDFCYNMLYNSIPLGLFKEKDELENAGFAAFRLNFTTEDRAETTEILRLYRGAYDQTGNAPGRFTRGHYQRGVE